jgi:two-component system response regulator FlrC
MRLLIVGALEGHITTASKIALSRGAKVSHVTTVDGALENLRSGKGADMVMIDVSLDVKDLVLRLQAERICVPVVACGISTDSKAPVAAIKAGAQEYVPLPPDPELIAAVLEAVAGDHSEFITKDPAMKSVFRLVDQIAPSDASVLIVGESGTGKEVMARYIHSHSRRKDKPFVTVNCAAIPENLLESELFGHEKGAFTGAIDRRIGKFEEANRGTLLLDEITEMHPRLQAKLLRAIQEREIDRVGGTKPIKVDIRVLATSNRNLEKEVESGNFREDLYFRLNVVCVELLPLRERPQDIEVLSYFFVDKYCRANGVALKKLAPAALEKLRQYYWRGNVRELENVIHRSILVTQGDEIGKEEIHIPKSAMEAVQGDINPTADGIPAHVLVGRTVADVEKDLIIGTLSHCLGNRTHAANILGISIRTLRNKLNLYTDEGTTVPQSKIS